MSRFNSKLNKKDVRKIKKALVTGSATQSALAEKYELCVPAINHIATGRTWTDITVPGWERYLKAKKIARPKAKKKKVKVRKRRMKKIKAQ